MHFKTKIKRKMLNIYKFEVTASKEVIVRGFSDIELARRWLIDNLEDECDDIIDASTYVSNGEELKQKSKEK